METKKSLLDRVKFIAEFTSHQMGCGINTSRIVRNTKRIGESLGFDVHVSVFQKNVILTLVDIETEQILSEVIENQELPVNFAHNSELSALSWEAIDNQLSFEEIKEKYYRIISAPRINFYLLLLLVGAANASFCRLFGGDWLSMFFVFVATVAGFSLKHLMQKQHINHFITFIAAAFIASIIASIALLFDTTSDIALATSVLYLIPGVPLINGVIDIVEGHTLTGISRLTNALLLIVCIAIGLSISLILVRNRLL